MISFRRDDFAHVDARHPKTGGLINMPGTVVILSNPQLDLFETFVFQLALEKVKRLFAKTSSLIGSKDVKIADERGMHSRVRLVPEVANELFSGGRLIDQTKQDLTGSIDAIG